jgi:hypothetical protein
MARSVPMVVIPPESFRDRSRMLSGFCKEKRFWTSQNDTIKDLKQFLRSLTINSICSLSDQ